MSKLTQADFNDKSIVRYLNDLMEVLPSDEGASFVLRDGVISPYQFRGTGQVAKQIRDLSWVSKGEHANLGAANISVVWPVPAGESWMAVLNDGSILVAYAGDSTFTVSTGSGGSGPASEVSAGIAEFATAAETEIGTDNTRSIHPAGASAVFVKRSMFDARGDLLSATADNTPVIVPVGADGTVLIADSTQASGLRYGTPQSIRDWSTAVAYRVGDYVNHSNLLYKCLIAHTSGVFGTDLAAVRWVEVSAGGGDKVIETLTVVSRNTINPLSFTPLSPVEFSVNGLAVDGITNVGTVVTVNATALGFNVDPSIDVVTAQYLR